jgi:RNA polymerase-binding transcription factor DksA
MKPSKQPLQINGTPPRRNQTRIPPKKTMDPVRMAKQRERLLRMGEHLSNEIHQMTAEACEELPSYSMHPADAGTDSFDRDLVLGLASFGQEGLYEIEAALKRIEDGSYGICELTGRPISWKRLKAIPWTRFSLEAEREIEGDIRPHIGELGTVRPAEAQRLEEVSSGSSDSGAENSFELEAEEALSR